MVRFGEAALLALAVAIPAAISGRRPWLFGLAVGAWTPLLEVIGSGRIESVAALVFAALGAAIGFGVSRSARSRL